MDESSAVLGGGVPYRQRSGSFLAVSNEATALVDALSLLRVAMKQNQMLQAELLRRSRSEMAGEWKSRVEPEPRRASSEEEELDRLISTLNERKSDERREQTSEVRTSHNNERRAEIVSPKLAGAPVSSSAPRWLLAAAITALLAALFTGSAGRDAAAVSFLAVACVFVVAATLCVRRISLANRHR